MDFYQKESIKKYLILCKVLIKLEMILMMIKPYFLLKSIKCKLNHHSGTKNNFPKRDYNN